MSTETQGDIQIVGSPEWHAARRTGIGGSDAAAAVGLSKWKTPLELFLEKRGEFTTVENEPMRWGTILEPVVRQEYANRTGREVVRPGSYLRHPTRPYAIANLDGIVDGMRLYEGKTARTAEGWGEPGTDEIPGEYMLQVQHCMAVVGLVVADVAVLISGQDFRVYEVPADTELQELLLDQEEEFWELVQQGVPPEPINSADIRRRWRFSTAKKVVASQEAIAAAVRLRAVKDALKEGEQQEEQLAALMQSEMQDAAELVDESGKPLATWKTAKAGTYFDKNRFEADHPELFKKYLRDSAPQRRFLLKVKGE